MVLTSPPALASLVLLLLLRLRRGTFCDIRNDFNFGPRRAATATNYSVTILDEIQQHTQTYTHTHTGTGKRKHSTNLCIMRNTGMEKSRTSCAHSTKTTNKKATKMTPTLTATAKALARVVFLVFVLSTRSCAQAQNKDKTKQAMRVCVCE